MKRGLRTGLAALVAIGALGVTGNALAAARGDGKPGKIGDAFLGAVSYTHLTLPTICSV